MRIATWNCNSLRSRVDRAVAFLERHDVDVLALQETKCRDDQFPEMVFSALGYEVAHHGHSQWNGVAILSKVGLDDVEDHIELHQSGLGEPLVRGPGRRAVDPSGIALKTITNLPFLSVVTVPFAMTVRLVTGGYMERIRPTG